MIGTPVTIPFALNSQFPDFDARKYKNGVPYVSKEDVLNSLILGQRAHYLEVNILGVWYYFEADLTTLTRKTETLMTGVEWIEFGFADIEALKVYPLNLDAFVSYEILGLSLQSDTGTVMATVSINGIDVTGLTAITGTDTIQRHAATALNIVAISDKITLTIDSIVDSTILWGALKIQRL